MQCSIFLTVIDINVAQAKDLQCRVNSAIIIYESQLLAAYIELGQ